MPTLPILTELPAGYFVDESPRGILVLHSDVARALHEAGFGPDSDGDVGASDLAGRQPLGELAACGERLVVRPFRRGGMLRWLLPLRFLDPDRPFRELIVSDDLVRSGVRTPRVLAARARRATGPFWRLDVVTRRVEGACDVGEALERLREGRLGVRERHALFRATGALLRDLHRLGLLHADLTPRNLLVELDTLASDGPRVWILDLDRAAFHASLDDADRRRNLRRLLRATLRRESRGRPFLARTDFARFLRAYDPEGGRWRADWRAIVADHRRARPLHGAGWMLEQLLGGGPQTRDGAAVVRHE